MPDRSIFAVACTVVGSATGARILQWIGIALLCVGATPAKSNEELGYFVPPGYTASRQNGMIVFTPKAGNRPGDACGTYGIVAPRPSSGDLSRDAQTALLQVVLPGWRRADSLHSAMRGYGTEGWPYFLFSAYYARGQAFVSAFAMALPAGGNQVHVVWGKGDPNCVITGLVFAELHYSLRPRTWASDGGKALARDLLGGWRNNQSAGMRELAFLPGGRYEEGLGTISRFGTSERTTGRISSGSYALKEGGLVLTRNDGRISKYYPRVYDEYVGGQWTRALSLLEIDGSTAREVVYYRVTR